jgi:hypothetical protein
MRWLRRLWCRWNDHPTRKTHESMIIIAHRCDVCGVTWWEEP